MSQKRRLFGTAVVIALLASSTVRAGEFPPVTYSASAGASEWALQFDKDGKLTVRRNGERAVEGDYKVEGDIIRVTDKTGPMACDRDQTGEYKWKIDGKRLTLAVISDACEERSHAFTQLEWTRTDK